MIGTLGSLGKDFIQCIKVLKAFLIKIIKTFCSSDTSHALTDSTRFNACSVQTDFQFRYLKACICWLERPNESRNKSRVKQLNTEKLVREGMSWNQGEVRHQHTLQWMPHCSPLPTASGTPSKRYWTKSTICFVHSIKDKNICLVHSVVRKAEGSERIIRVLSYYWLFTINTEWQLSGSSKKVSLTNQW